MARPSCKVKQVRYRGLSLHLLPVSLLPHPCCCDSIVFPWLKVLWMQAAWTLTHALLYFPRFSSLLRPHTSTSVRALASKRAPAPCTLAPRIRRTCCASLMRCFCVSSPNKTWSSLWINFDCKKLPRRDSQNAAGSSNFTFSLRDFQGGGLWLEEAAAPPAAGNLVDAPAPLADAPHTRGRVIDTNRRPCCFPASALHATMPWQGHRWLVTAYLCQHVPTLSASASALLRGSDGLHLVSASCGS